MSERVIYCRGCQHAWIEDPVLVTLSLLDRSAEERVAVDTCACTCADDSDPLYEAWVVGPDPAGIPPGAWGER